MKPWLFLPPKIAHDLAPLGLSLLSALNPPQTFEWQPFEWRGLSFKNRLGIAGGVDKNAEQIEQWENLGAGFLEIGTVTPQPQGPNSGRIIDRDVRTSALWNRMGFPGKGAAAVAERLKTREHHFRVPVFINIGRNRTTPNEFAARDYCTCIETLSFAADAFVINISSPNTSGLRDLFQPANFRAFLEPIRDARDKASNQKGTKAPIPLLLKLSPDLSKDDLKPIVAGSLEHGIDGWIATNTTLQRDPGSKFPQEGGVSGKPLTRHAEASLINLVSLLGSDRGDRLIVAAGGVMTPADVARRLSLGADLVQVYSALVFEGPSFFKKTAAHMKTRTH